MTKILNRIDQIFLWIGMGALFAIMFIIAIDGIGRNFFDAPIKGAYVVIENYLMVAMIFPVVGYTWAQRGHISVTLFVTKLPKAVQNIAYLVVLLLGLVFFGIVTYTGADTTLAAIASHKMTTGLIRWPYWLAYMWMPLGGILFCLRMITEFVICLQRIFRQGIGNVLLTSTEVKHDGNSD